MQLIVVTLQQAQALAVSGPRRAEGIHRSLIEGTDFRHNRATVFADVS